MRFTQETWGNITFDAALAVEIGLNEAIMLYRAHALIQQTKETAVDLDGITDVETIWIANTSPSWRSSFPFWSLSTFRRTMKSLSDMGLLTTRHGDNTDPFDHTKWFTIDYETVGNVYDGLDKKEAGR